MINIDAQNVDARSFKQLKNRLEKVKKMSNKEFDDKSVDMITIKIEGGK